MKRAEMKRRWPDASRCVVSELYARRQLGLLAVELKGAVCSGIGADGKLMRNAIRKIQFHRRFVYRDLPFTSDVFVQVLVIAIVGELILGDVAEFDGVIANSLAPLC
jgi:hypothetical protein